MGYRRHGHNEGDEPAFTQPALYERIQAHPTVRERWAATLVERGVIPPEAPPALEARYVAALEEAVASLDPATDLEEPRPAAPPPGAAKRVRTAVPAERLRELGEGLRRLPEGFTVHPKLARLLQRRREALGEADAPPLDWAAAEELAWASILADGISIRLTGQDTERGTFGQRHAVLHDVTNGKTHTPLQALPQAPSRLRRLQQPPIRGGGPGLRVRLQRPGP